MGARPSSPILPDVRLIAPDRPGYGRTDFVDSVTTLENGPKDVVALADSLRLDRFAVLGACGGGPYALASAGRIPERPTAAGLSQALALSGPRPTGT